MRKICNWPEGQDGLMSTEDREKGFGHSVFETNWHFTSQITPEVECVPFAEWWLLLELPEIVTLGVYVLK